MNVYLVTFQDNLHLHEIPIAPAYLMSYVKSLPELENVNIEIKSYNIFVSKFQQFTQIRSLIKELSESKVDVIGFSCYMWSLRLIESIIPQIKKKLPDIKIVFGGPEVSPLANETLNRNKYVDIIVRGEGEITFAQVLKKLLNRQELTGVDGISYRKNNEIIENPDREQINDLDIIPSPILSGLLDKNIEKLNKDSLNLFDIELARGCKRKCAYCYFGRGFNSVYRFSIDRIVKEIEYIVNFNTIPKYIVLWDSNLIQDKNYFKELCIHLTRLYIKYNIAFKSEIDIYNVTEEIAELLKHANVNVSIGLQTISNESLRICNRRQLDPEKFSEKVNILKQAGIQLNFEIIMGLPGDSYQGVIDTLKFATRIKPHHVNAFPLFVLPGTLFYEKKNEYGIKVSPNVNHLMESSNYFSRQELADLMSLSTEMLERYNQGYLLNLNFNENIIKATKLEIEKLIQSNTTTFEQISGEYSGSFNELIAKLNDQGRFEQKNENGNFAMLQFNNGEVIGFVYIGLNEREKILNIKEIWIKNTTNIKQSLKELLITSLHKAIIANCNVCIAHNAGLYLEIFKNLKFVKEPTSDLHINYIPLAYKNWELGQLVMQYGLNLANFSVEKNNNADYVILYWKHKDQEQQIKFTTKYMENGLV